MPSIVFDSVPHAVFTRSAQRIFRTTIAFIFLYGSLALLFHYWGKTLEPELSVETVKLFSLLFLSLHAQSYAKSTTVMTEAPSGGRPHGQRFGGILSLVHTFIRWYSNLVSLLLGALVTIKVLVALNPRGAIDMSKFASTPDFWLYSLHYAVNGMVLLPIILYGIANHLQVNRTGTLRSVRKHLQNFLFFVNLPFSISVIAFLFLSMTILEWKQPDQAALFLGGAAALLMFLTVSIAICIDEHASVVLYRTASQEPTVWWSYSVLGGIIVFGAIALSFPFLAPEADILLGREGLILVCIGGAIILHGYAAALGWSEFFPSVLIGLMYALIGAILTGVGSNQALMLAGLVLLAIALLKFWVMLRTWDLWGPVLGLSFILTSVACALALTIALGVALTFKIVLFVLSIDVLGYGVWWLLLGHSARDGRYH